MSDIHCKFCSFSHYVRDGFVRGHQRYKCKECKRTFTATPLRGKPAAMKALAILLYSMGNMSFCGIARLLEVSDVAIMKWIREQAKGLPEPEMPSDVRIITLDEMWHFLKKRQKRSGSGERLILSSGELWPGFWVSVMMQPLKNSSIK